MSEKHFEAFLVSNLRGWLQSRIETGARYQFKSPDPENTNALVSELLTRSDGQLRYGEHELSYLEVNDVRLLVAGHLEQPDIENGCYTENYISNLRDTVAAQMPPFASCALLIVHNSLLDTLINSAFDLAQGDAVWSPRQTKNALDLMISGGLQNQVASRCLLEHQARLITEEGSSVFGFRHLHDALLNGDLRFQELGLFNDPQVLSNSSEKQVARRLESNRQLREEIEFAVEHFPNDLEDKLTKFGSKFIQEHFGEGAEVPWTELNYQAFRDEEELQKKLTLDYEGIEVKGCEIDVRDKKDTSAGRRDKHLIIEVPSGQDMFNFKIKFVGQRLDKKELLVTPKAMSDVIDIDFSFRGDKSTFTISGPYRGEPEFFSLRLNRDASNEKYSFSCLVVQNGVFHLSAFENRFLIDRKRKALVLQADQHCLDVNPELITETVLSDSDETVDVNSVGKINFEQLYDESDEVNFTLTNENRSLFVLVEGEPSKEALRLPVIFDSSRFARLFKDDNFNAEFEVRHGTTP